MKLEDKLRSDVGSGKLQSPPSALQGVTKQRISEVLRTLDRESRDRVDAVFALLDDINPNLLHCPRHLHLDLRGRREAVQR